MDPLSQQVSDIDEEQDVGYIRCMSRLKVYPEEYDIGRKVISRVKSGKNSVIFAEILPFLICWTLDVERLRAKAAGWLGLQEAKTSAELNANSKKLLSHVVMNQKRMRNILEDLSITDLSLAYLMMASSWEELEEFCLKRGIKVVGPDLKDSREIRDKKFINEARIVFEKLNKYKENTPIEYLQGIGSNWYRRDKEAPSFIQRWLPRKEWLFIKHGNN